MASLSVSPKSFAPSLEMLRPQFAGRSYLVTGGAGFIGSHLVEALLHLGAKVKVLDDLSTGRSSNLSPLASPSLELIIGSILDPALLQSACEGVQGVFHEAAWVAVPSSVADPAGCYRLNITGSELVLNGAIHSKAQRFVAASSAAIFGNSPPLPTKEEAAIDCYSPYAASKASMECLAQSAARSRGIEAVCLRYFNVFGPRQDPRSAYSAVISAFADHFSRGEAPTIFGNGQQSRDFVPVSVIVEANLRAMCETLPSPFRAYNIGTGTRTTLLALFEMMRQCFAETNPTLLDLSPVFRETRAGDVAHSSSDPSRAAKELALAIPQEILSALRETCQWYAQTQQSQPR